MADVNTNRLIPTTARITTSARIGVRRRSSAERLVRPVAVGARGDRRAWCPAGRSCTGAGACRSGRAVLLGQGAALPVGGTRSPDESITCVRGGPRRCAKGSATSARAPVPSGPTRPSGLVEPGRGRPGGVRPGEEEDGEDAHDQARTAAAPRAARAERRGWSAWTGPAQGRVAASLRWSTSVVVKIVYASRTMTTTPGQGDRRADRLVHDPAQRQADEAQDQEGIAEEDADAGGHRAKLGEHVLMMPPSVRPGGAFGRGSRSGGGPD